MLDANICIHAMKGDSLAIRRHLIGRKSGDVLISSIVVAELWTGVMKSQQRHRNEQALTDFLRFAEVLDWPATASRIYGELRARLEAKGRPIGAMDMLIAAHAIHEQAILITRNRREFARVEGLKVESWDA